MTNISITQSGIPRDSKLKIGGLSSHEQSFEWENLRDVFSANNPDYITIFDDFLLQSENPMAKYTITDFGTFTDFTILGAISQITPGEAVIRAGSNAMGNTENGYTQMATATAWTVGSGQIIFKCRFRIGNPPPATAFDTKMELGISTARAIATDGIHFEDHTEAGLDASANIGSARAILIGGGDNDSGSNFGVCSYNGSVASSQDTETEFAVRSTIYLVTISINEIGDATVTFNDEIFEFLSVFDVGDKVTPYFSVKNYDTGADESTVILDYLYISGPR